MYAIKAANPYYSYREWGKDKEIGTTDFERRVQLAELAETMPNLPPERQQFWSGQLSELMANDKSAEMRRLAVRAAAGIDDASSLTLIEKGLDDESVKVRMEACRVLASKQSNESARLLAATVGTETDQDVKHAAMKSLAAHSSPVAIKSLSVALKDRNPATRSLAVASLKGSTGKDLGDDPQTWIAALEKIPDDSLTPGAIGGPGDSETKVANRLQDIFR
ncbi:HEAT repeat domain-containing protein [Rubripirellula amarantea]|nr:HEAT repeat domain-containing protein [Rubripirellula amarantea]